MNHFYARKCMISANEIFENERKCNRFWCDSYFMLFGVGVSCRCFCILVLVIYMQAVADQLPRLGKRELICLLSFTSNYVVSVWRGFLFPLTLGMRRRIGCF